MSSYEKIKQIVLGAMNVLDQELSKLAANQESQHHKDLLVLKNAYLKLLELIQTAQDQHATVGVYILLHQLNQSEQNLNAAQLLTNFLKVLDYPQTTTFSMNQQPHQQSRIDIAKQFAMFPLIFMVVMCVLFSPMLVLSFKPGLMLLISALPLAITYAYDKPFSMSRWYQEMAGIEKALAYSVLGCTGALLLLITAPEITMLGFGIAFISILSTGLAFLWHSNHLQSKHENLQAATNKIKLELPSETSPLSFFKKQSIANDPQHLLKIEKTLQDITYNPM